MPCDTVQLNRIDLPKMHPAMMARAVASMRATTDHNARNFYHGGHWYSITGGELTSRTATLADVQKTAALLKKHYSAEVVKYTAQRNGWKVKQTGAFQFEVIK